MYYTASLALAATVTFYLVSQIAKMLHAKRPDIGWVVLASVVGGVLAFISFILLKTFIVGLDPLVILAISLFAAFIVSSASFKAINQMSWGNAITTSVANIAIGSIALVAAVVLNGESLKETFQTVSNVAKQNASVVEYVATGEEVEWQEELLDDDQEGFVNDASDEETEGQLEATFNQLDLLPPAAVLAKQKKAKRTYVEPKYHVISINRLGSVVGKAIRIKRKNGSVVAGSLVKMLGNDVVIAQRLSNGTATTPISIAEIQKLEVYK